MLPSLLKNKEDYGRINRGERMNTKDTFYLFENMMELIVDEVIEDLLKVPSLDVCKCDRCHMDIKALSLNRLPPKYVVTQRGEVYAKLDVFRNQIRVDVLTAVVEAIEIVKQNPSHVVEKTAFIDEEY